MSYVEPDLPEGIEDRAADIWEPLATVADAAGGDWPSRARAAAVYLTAYAREESQTRGVELLEHIREAFEEEDKLSTAALLKRLCDRDESPWRDISGGRSNKEKSLTDRGLASRLKQYGIKSKTVRMGDVTAKGYDAADFYDAWGRYCPSACDSRNKRHSRHLFDNENNYVSAVTDVAATVEADLEIPDSLRRCAHCGGGPEPGNPINKVAAPDGERLVPVHRFCAEAWMKIELEGK